jgi:hypothetical protein
LKTLLIFIDGVGLGDTGAANPFIFVDTPAIQALLQGQRLCRKAIGFSDRRASLLGLDAVLDVCGLPQSATGQATIFSGVNAPRLLGSHLNGYPNKLLRDMLAERGIFKQFKQKGYRCAFANAYRPPFFEHLKSGLPGYKYSCSTLVTYYGGVAFRSLDHLRNGEAVYMDIDNTFLQQMGVDVERITPEEAGRRLIAISGRYDFTMFEYFFSDLAGHSTDLKKAIQVVETLDRFIGAVAEELDTTRVLLIVTSDHGNMEDLRHKEHTTNPVPALLVGDQKLRQIISARMNNLTDILPATQFVLAWECG